MFDAIDPFIIQLTTLKGPKLVIVFLIMLGYMLKMLPQVPNRVIPFVNCLVGPVLSVFLVAWPTPGSMDHDLLYPHVAAWVQAVINGALLAILAWVIHRQVLRKYLDDKVQAWKDKTPAPSPAQAS